jgi:membrane-bound serine protease (ClpP class)
VRTLAIALVVVGAVLGLSGTVTAQTATSAPVNVVQVSGYLDRVEVDYITKAISEAQHDGAQALVLQMNSSRAVVSSSQVARLAERIAASPVPVAIWVGPSGARA